jgi:hypothetical protein
LAASGSKPVPNEDYDDYNEFDIHDDDIIFDRIDQALDEFVHELSIARCLHCPEVANDVHDLDDHGSCMDLAATCGVHDVEVREILSAASVVAFPPDLDNDFGDYNDNDTTDLHGVCPEVANEVHDLAAQEHFSAASGRTFDMGVIDLVGRFNGDLSGCGDTYLSELVIAFCLRLRSHDLYGPLSLLPLPSSFWQDQASQCICGFAKHLREAIRQAGTSDSMEIFERYVDNAAFNFLEVMHESARKLDLC